MGDTLGMVADVINETAPLPHPLTKQGGRRGTGGTLIPGLFPQLDSSLLQVCVNWPRSPVVTFQTPPLHRNLWLQFGKLEQTAYHVQSTDSCFFDLLILVNAILYVLTGMQTGLDSQLSGWLPRLL